MGRDVAARASSLRQRLKPEKTQNFKFGLWRNCRIEPEARTCRCQARRWGKTMHVYEQSPPCHPQAGSGWG